MLLTSWRSWKISTCSGSRLTIGLFLILRARSAYRRVLRVSSKFESAGLTHATITVWLFPPRESAMEENKGGAQGWSFNLSFLPENPFGNKRICSNWQSLWLIMAKWPTQSTTVWGPGQCCVAPMQHHCRQATHMATVLCGPTELVAYAFDWISHSDMQMLLRLLKCSTAKCSFHRHHSYMHQGLQVYSKFLVSNVWKK